MAGYQPSSGSLSPKNFPCFVFQLPRQQLFPKGCHYLPRTYSNYPRKQGNRYYSSIHRLNSQNENLSKARTKGSSRKQPPFPLGKLSTTYRVSLCETVSFITFLSGYNLTQKKERNGAICSAKIHALIEKINIQNM